MRCFIQDAATKGIFMHKFMWLMAGLSLACNRPAEVEPNAGQWKTQVIASGGAHRLPAPPDAAGTAAEIQRVKDCFPAGVAFPGGVIGGMDLGTQVGQAAIAYAKADGSNQVFSGSFLEKPGVWGSPKTRCPAGGHVASVGTHERQSVPPQRTALIRLQ